MTRFARVVVPGLPHHVTQRGNRREPIFFENGDQEVYRDLLAEQMRKGRVVIWAYCLMPNHVHLIAEPQDEAGLARAMGEAHRRYTNFINARSGWSGHLFQNRFASLVMDEDHLRAAVRYVHLNPVRAKLVARAQDWPWSSARAHTAGEDDELVVVRALKERGLTGEDLMQTQARDDAVFADIRARETTGRPLGNEEFICGLERLLGRPIARRAPGRKPFQPEPDQPKLL